MILNNNSLTILIFLRSSWFFISVYYLCYKWLYLCPTTLKSLYIYLIFVLLDGSLSWFITAMYASKVFLKLINIKIINELHFLLFAIRRRRTTIFSWVSLILISIFPFILINHILNTLREELFVFLILIWVNTYNILIFIIIKWK